MRIHWRIGKGSSNEGDGDVTINIQPDGIMRTELFVRLTAFLFLFVGVATAGPEGVLVIVGGGKIPADVREELFKLAGGKDRARIVVLPTASAAAHDPKQDDAFLKPWRDLGPISAQLLHTRDRKVADDPAFVKPLVKATAVCISGGDQNRLIAAYRGTLLETELHKLLQRGGVIGGTSAGAAVMSDLMIEGGNPKARTGPGFGFLKGIVVDQHFAARHRLDRLRGVLAKNKDFAGLGIDEGTAAIVRGQSLTVKGSSTVTAIWSQSSSQPAKEKTLKAGTVLDLASLRPTLKPK
jgi:cyanophycinase